MDYPVFKPSNELTFDTVVNDLNQLFLFMKKNTENRFSLDLSEVTLCDSAGLALLVEAKRLGKQQNQTVKMEGIPPTVDALAKFCGVDTLLRES